VITTFTYKDETSLCYFILKTIRFFCRTLYMQYGIFYLHRCEQSGGYEDLEHTLLSTRLLTPMHANCTNLHVQLSP